MDDFIKVGDFLPLSNDDNKIMVGDGL